MTKKERIEFAELKHELDRANGWVSQLHAEAAATAAADNEHMELLRSALGRNDIHHVHEGITALVAQLAAAGEQLRLFRPLLESAIEFIELPDTKANQGKTYNVVSAALTLALTPTQAEVTARENAEKAEKWDDFERECAKIPTVNCTTFVPYEQPQDREMIRVEKKLFKDLREKTGLLDKIYSLATRALAEPASGDAFALIQICSEIEAVKVTKEEAGDAHN